MLCTLIPIISFVLQGDYEMVISDYGRAKSLFAGTDIKIFKRGVLSNYSYLLRALSILCTAWRLPVLNVSEDNQFKKTIFKENRFNPNKYPQVFYSEKLIIISF